MKHIHTFKSFLNEAAAVIPSVQEIIKSIRDHKWTGEQNRELSQMVPKEKEFVKTWIDTIVKAMEPLDNSDGSMDWKKFDSALFDARGEGTMVNGMSARFLFLGKDEFSKWLDQFLAYFRGTLYIPGEQIGSFNYGTAAYVLTLLDLGFEQELKDNNYDIVATMKYAKSNLNARDVEANIDRWERSIEKEEKGRGGNTTVKLFDPYADKVTSGYRANKDAVNKL